MKKVIALLLAVSISIMGCASKTPNPVPLAQVGDETKTCDAITNEMQQMIDAKTMAEGDGNTQVGKNVALGVTGIFLIVPWFFMDLGNAATVEQRAAQARFQRLQQMAFDKKCPNTPVMKPDVTASNSDSQSSQAEPGSLATVSPEAGVVAKSQNLTPQSPTSFSTSNSKNDDLPNPVRRLDDLNALLKKGLITQKDYDTKKAEILKNL
jgi:hypothetical protein